MEEKKYKSVKVRPPTWKKLKELSYKEEMPIPDLIEKAIQKTWPKK